LKQSIEVTTLAILPFFPLKTFFSFQTPNVSDVVRRKEKQNYLDSESPNYRRRRTYRFNRIVVNPFVSESIAERVALIFSSRKIRRFARYPRKFSVVS
jgi:hypothetical protein